MSFSKEEKRDRAGKIIARLGGVYRETPPLLNFTNPYELLAGTVLAAQCTDDRVNRVTPVLFRKYPDFRRLAKAPVEDIEEIIRSTGFFRQKAGSLKKLSETIVANFNGQIPGDMDDLVSLPGVGRKTANVLLSHCFGKPAIIVDTHLSRVVSRLGLAEKTNPDKIEIEIKEIVPEKEQSRFSGLINYHGRYRCHARKPDCANCEIRDLCPYPETGARLPPRTRENKAVKRSPKKKQTG
jgi:endonuclease III